MTSAQETNLRRWRGDQSRLHSLISQTEASSVPHPQYPNDRRAKAPTKSDGAWEDPRAANRRSP